MCPQNNACVVFCCFSVLNIVFNSNIFIYCKETNHLTSQLLCKRDGGFEFHVPNRENKSGSKSGRFGSFWVDFVSRSPCACVRLDLRSSSELCRQLATAPRQHDFLERARAVFARAGHQWPQLALALASRPRSWGLEIQNTSRATRACNLRGIAHRRLTTINFHSKKNTCRRCSVHAPIEHPTHPTPPTYRPGRPSFYMFVLFPASCPRTSGSASCQA